MRSGIEPADVNGVRVLAPAVATAAFATAISHAAATVCEPFQPERVAVLEHVSNRILRHPKLRREPGGAALGFWLRRSHLAALQAEFKQGAPANATRVAAGVVFHIAPANVDTMFVLSWALSFLAGNANIVRLTTRSNAVVDDLLAILSECFREAPAATAGNWFVTYEHNDAITTHLSLLCDTRIIWGGDETVKRIRALPLSPHATERAFASKRSLSIFSTAGYLTRTEAGRNDLANRMAADIAPFGQMACSSPHVLFWLGTARAEEAGTDFGQKLEQAMAARTEPELGGATRRITHAFAAAASGSAVSLRHSTFTTIVTATTAAQAEPEELCGAGLLVQAACESPDEIAATLRRDHQTITYDGLDKAARASLARIAGRAGVDRIVPVGRALDFGARWDGYDLWGDLTRCVVVE